MEARRSASTSRRVVLQPAAASLGDTVDGDLKRVEKEAAEAEAEEPEEGEAPRETEPEMKGKREAPLQTDAEDLVDAGDLIDGNKTLAEVRLHHRRVTPPACRVLPSSSPLASH